MAAGQEFVIVISICLLANICSAQNGVKGPPQAEQKEVKKVGRIGDNIKLVCPITGFPTPIVEWSKNGEKIDYMWERHRTGRKSLKIKHINEDDTGIFTCKGINGFGSEEVRIELIVVDPRTLPSGIDDSLSVAPPTFTFDTKMSQKVFVKTSGETFKVSCEALGSPEPEIFWFKDGAHISEPVHYQRGRSTVEFSVMGSADSGVYTCRARNLIGEKTVNFTLDVEVPQGTNHAVVTEVGPVNTTVTVGEQATLQCRIKSLTPPHIKWLKKMEPHEPSTENTLSVASDRYRILHSDPDVNVDIDGAFVNQFVIEAATMHDAGLYICFVTNSGYAAMTYKSMILKVEESQIQDRDNHHRPTIENDSFPILLVAVIIIAVVVFFFITAIVFVACAKKRNDKHHQKRSTCESQSSTDCSEVGRPFMPTNAGYKNNNLMINKPLPPTPLPLTLAQWSHQLNPKYPAPSIQDSGFSTVNVTAAEKNIYEPPYAQLVRPYGRNSEDLYLTQEAFLHPGNYSRYGHNNQQSSHHVHHHWTSEYEN